MTEQLEQSSLVEQLEELQRWLFLILDHPDIETFIEWKAIEEDKARALIAAGYPADFNGEAYATVSGQNSNNSVRVPTEFSESY